MDQTTSHPSVKFFELPVALKFKNPTQEKTIVVNNKYNGELFFKYIGFIADTVIVDPDYWLITRNNITEKVNNNVSGANNVQIFPSPFSNNFYVYLRNFTATRALLKVYDSKGSLVLNKNLSTDVSLFSEVDAQSFAPGIYFIKIQTDNGVKFVKKIIKQ